MGLSTYQAAYSQDVVVQDEIKNGHYFEKSGELSLDGNYIDGLKGRYLDDLLPHRPLKESRAVLHGQTKRHHD